MGRPPGLPSPTDEAMTPALMLWLALAAQPDPAFIEAVKLHQAGKLAAAVEQYRVVLKASPNNFEVRSNLGAALTALGRYQEAITEYRTALRSAPANPALRTNLALAYYKASLLPEAAAEFAALHKSDPEDLKLALLLADCHFRLGEDKKVIEVLEPLGRKHTESAAVDYLLGTALIREGRVGEGQALVDRILGRGDSPEAHLMLGAAQMRTARFEEAAREFARALELNPKLLTANLLLGQAKNELGDRDGAARAFRNELSLDANNYEANLQLGILLKDDQRVKEALPYLTRAAELRPGWMAAPYQIAAAHIALGDLNRARIELERLVKQEPKFAEAHVSLATVYLRLGRKEEATRERDIAAKLAAGDH